MRPILALAILLIGLKGAAPEAKLPNAYPDMPDSPVIVGQDAHESASLENELSRKSDRAVVAAIPAAESSEAGHDLGEDNAEPLQSPVMTSPVLEVDSDTPVSLERLCNTLLVSAKQNRLPVPFFANLIWQESRLQHDAVSPVGALGIAQFMPRVAVEVGLDDPFDPRQAIPASARMLRALRERFGNLGFVAAAYNAGAHRVREWLDHHRALPQETRTYVVHVTGRSVEEWRKTPPDDSSLTFMRPLPCRELPAFADLAPAQSQPVQQKALPAQPTAVQKPGQTRKAEQAVGRTPLGTRQSAAARKPAQCARRDLARIAHGDRHQTSHHQNTPHEKRRTASAEIKTGAKEDSAGTS